MASGRHAGVELFDGRLARFGADVIGGAWRGARPAAAEELLSRAGEHEPLPLDEYLTLRRAAGFIRYVAIA
jgi:hypothetical protein